MLVPYSLSDLRGEAYFEILRRENVQAALHVHHSMEFFYVWEGSAQALVDRECRTVRQGEGTFILPYQCHGYRTPVYSKAVVLLFSPQLAEEFHTLLQSRQPARMCWPLDEALTAYLQSHLPPDGEIREPVTCKALLYPLCAAFLKDNPLTERPGRQDEPVRRVLLYLWEHAAEPITLTETARRLALHPAYLSRAFAEKTGMTFTECLHTLRIMRACELLRETDKPVSDVAFDAGFGSLRSFNRIFSELIGETPRAFRKRERGRPALD